MTGAVPSSTSASASSAPAGSPSTRQITARALRSSPAFACSSVRAASVARAWPAQLKADTAAKLDDLDARMDRRADQLDAKVAAGQAEGAEADAAEAIDFAAWTVDNAR